MLNADAVHTDIRLLTITYNKIRFSGIVIEKVEIFSDFIAFG